jgi:hypothetical protein
MNMTRRATVPEQQAKHSTARSLVGRTFLPVLLGGTIGATLALVGISPTISSTAIAAGVTGLVAATALSVRNHRPLYVSDFTALMGASLATVFVLVGS